MALSKYFLSYSDVRIAKILVVVYFICFGWKLSSQPSFQLVSDSLDIYLDDIAVNDSDELMSLIFSDRPEVSHSFYLVKPESSGSSYPAWKVSYGGAAIGQSKKMVYSEENVCLTSSLVGGSYESSLTCVNALTGNGWRKKIFNNYLGGAAFTVDGDNNVVLVNSPPRHDTLYNGENVIEYNKINSDGEVISKNGFRFEGINEEFDLLLKEIGTNDHKDFYLTGGIYYASLDRSQFILKINELGLPIKTVMIPDIVFGKMVVAADGIYLLDKGFFEFFWNYDQYDPLSSILIKLDAELNFLWGKKFYAENFDYSTAELIPTPSGGVLTAHSTVGAFPAILAELDEEGNILWQKGYPNLTPRMRFLSDGSLILASQKNLNNIGEIINQPVIAKTDENGDIEGCSTYTTCLHSEDFFTEVLPIGFDTIIINDLEELGIEVEPAFLSFSESCNYPPMPSPDFTHPDTLCIGDIRTAIGTNNRFANAREWQLTGPNIDSTLQDSLGFFYEYVEAGEYVLRQTVWVLGCAYDYEKKITVLPELEARIVPEHICPDSLPIIFVDSDRDLVSHAWGNGETSSAISVDDSGLYSVTVSDGYCWEELEGEVNLLSDILGADEALTLPEDTTICEIHLPFSIEPSSPYADSFYISGNTGESYERLILESAGTYLIGMEIHGCPFYEEYRLKTSNCEAGIYMPTAFSPNGDGINDSFFPQSKNFETIKLEIYDRWGGQLYLGKGTGAAWSPGQEINLGTYLYHIHYLNLLTGKEEVLSGEVSVVR